MHQKLFINIALAIILSFQFSVVNAQKTSIPLPSPAQLQWQNDERVMFIHYGPATWQNREYDNLSTPLSRMKMPKLDTDQWCRVAKSWGAKMILFVAKHVGGFSWWRTNTTDYGVKEIPWQHGAGDLLKEVSASCKRFGLKLGIYIYPGDDHWGSGIGSGGITKDPSKQEAYNKVFRQQLTEVLSKYGHISEVWFDGNCRIDVKDIIERYASNAVVFQGPCASLRWVGNEDGCAPDPNWYTLKSNDLKTGVATALHSDVNGDSYAPVEVDVPLMNNGGHKWFWGVGCDSLIMPLPKLMDLYDKSVGRGSVLLMDVTPDTTGLIPAAQVRALQAFGKEIAKRYGHSIASTKGNAKVLLLRLPKKMKVNQAVLREDLSAGQRVLSYRIEAKDSHGKWIKVTNGTSVGNRKIDSFDAVTTQLLRLTVTNSKEMPRIREFSVFYNAPYSTAGNNMKGDFRTVAYWDSKTYSPDEWKEVSFDLTPYMKEVGEYKVRFTYLATDYLEGKSSALQVKDYHLTMYGGSEDKSLSWNAKDGCFTITRSQQTLNEFPTTLRMKIKRGGAASVGELRLTRVHY